MAAPIYIPIYLVWGIPFLTSSPEFINFGLFDDRHSNRCEKFSFHVPFHVPIGHLYVFFGEISI